ncbi:MAG TPA: hypothetical protein VGH36_14430 [Acetobacteraceae bacterium]|jgi:hypothetical protein
MITRSDIIMLGLYSGVSGALIGGGLLGVGLNLMSQGVNIGLLLITPAAPIGAIVAWILARRLAAKLPPSP